MDNSTQQRFAGRSVARTSDDYVQDIVKRREMLRQATGRSEPTLEERNARLAAISSDRGNAMRRLGQGLIGPIQLKLRYKGLVRNVLREDALTPGIPIEYDVLDELGQAYVLHGSEGEVKITAFEGKKAPIRLFRIAAFPRIKKEDLWWLRVNIVEYVQDESKQAIMRQEDARLITLLDNAITQYGNNPANPYGRATRVNELSGYLTPDSLYDLSGIIEGREIETKHLLMNPKDYRDLYKWDINETGFAFKDKVVAGEKVTEFGEYTIQKSITVPQGTIYVAPDPQFLGVFPIMYSLDVEENNKLEDFQRGWVLDELVGMAVLNPRGIGAVQK